MSQTMSPSFLEMSAAALGRAIAAGQVDPVELAEEAIARARAGTRDHVFLNVTAERATREAHASRKRHADRRPLSALDGVPIAWKDLFDLAGEVTTAASPLMSEAPPADRDAGLVANAAAAGMVTIGKTNLTEFAYSGLGLNPHYGTPANPFGTSRPRAPGGSSSGSAVAVASGMVPCAMGTDTAGSVRIPAAFNGLVGYKTGGGRYDMSGVFPLSPSLDTLGPLARTVEDCVALDTVMRGITMPAIRRRPVDALHLVVPQTVVLEDLQPEVAENFERSVERLRSAGARIERRPVEQFAESAELASTFGTITSAEAYLFHRERVGGPDNGRIDSRVVDRILLGKGMSAADLLTLQQARARLVASMKKDLGDALVVMPSVAITAPEIAALEADDQLFHATNLKVLRNTILGSYLDMPGVALPNGMDGDGLPTSLLVSAGSGRDDYLLGCALGMEACLSGAALGRSSKAP